jgi:hypothetical protein
VPIPASPAQSDTTSTLTALFRQVHEALRHELHDLDDDTLNWTPWPGTNSIATIITHLVGSEAETFRALAGDVCERDRDAEFANRGLTRPEVLGLLKAADDLIAELEPRITADRLATLLPLPTLREEEARPGLTWLASNYGHAREHLGHVQLTKQIHQREGSSPS